MSGSGGNHDWDRTEKQFDCAGLIERTLINSAVPAVVAGLKVTDVLQVTLSSIGGAQILQAITSTGAIAGSLTPPRLPQIIECIGNGFVFVAVVLEINGGAVKVEIRAESK
jgi:hypothetical protein